jgi:hypothetical protein
MPSNAPPRELLVISLDRVSLLADAQRSGTGGDNALNFLLLHPRAGVQEVFATTGVIPELTGQTEVDLTRTVGRILFKEEIRGPAELLVNVVDRNDRDGLRRFLAALARNTALAAGDTILRGIPGLLKTAFRTAAATGRMTADAIGTEGVAIISSGGIVLGPDLAGEVRIPLYATEDLRPEGKPHRKTGEANGEVVIRMDRYSYS